MTTTPSLPAFVTLDGSQTWPDWTGIDTCTCGAALPDVCDGDCPQCGQPYWHLVAATCAGCGQPIHYDATRAVQMDGGDEYHLGCVPGAGA